MNTTPSHGQTITTTLSAGRSGPAKSLRLNEGYFARRNALDWIFAVLVAVGATGGGRHSGAHLAQSAAAATAAAASPTADSVGQRRRCNSENGDDQYAHPTCLSISRAFHAVARAFTISCGWPFGG